MKKQINAYGLVYGLCGGLLIVVLSCYFVDRFGTADMATDPWKPRR
ncbi:MAG: hypothetical protein M3410_07810 [Acidobacteriota bacterium]|nr:hypothetical protein [Acidobacteriota bacterium]